MARRKVFFDFNPLAGVRLPKGKKQRAYKEIRELLEDEILSHVGEGRSPVEGYGKFKRLDADYADAKKGGNRTPNLELTGNMLDGLKIVQKGSKIRVTVAEKQQPKADGHNNFSGKSSLPLRRFVPNSDQNESFNKRITSRIDEIVASYDSEDE
jgi:hypothetical protein